jgi:hypothetical protein
VLLDETRSAAAAGLLRRLGDRDLAWSLLYRARPADTDDQIAQAEWVWLLTSMGIPGTRADRAERYLAAARSVRSSCAAAFAHVTAGQRRQAEQLLDEAADRVADEGAAAKVTTARAGSAMPRQAPGALAALAPALLEEAAPDLISTRTPRPFMIVARQATDTARKVIPAAMHTDGTLRPQTVTRDDTDPYARPPALLNTSRNHEADPTVCARATRSPPSLPARSTCSRSDRSRPHRS